MDQQICKTARIAVIGAGAAGLTAAHTLKGLGYRNVTVYEKDEQPGGKVLTDHSLGFNVELGAVFATEAHELTLQLAKEVGLQTVRLERNAMVLDEDRGLVPAPQFAIRKHGPAKFQSAIGRYQVLSHKYRINKRRGFAGLPPEVHIPFAEFAFKYDVVPVADMFRAQFVAWGYPYYEIVPAMYYLILIDCLLNIEPTGFRPWRLYLFPDGFQELWLRIAKRLEVHCSSEITGMQRIATDTGTQVHIAVNGEEAVYDWVILTTPPSATRRYLDMTTEEEELLGQAVSHNYCVTVAKVSGLTSDSTSVYSYANARPAGAGHINCWYDPAPGQPVFVSYQNLGRSQTEDDAHRLLESDFAALGGTVEGILLRRQWEHFAHVETPALNAGFYERFEALQGKNGTLYATGLLGLETVEHTARYAHDLMVEFFAPARASRHSAGRGLSV